MKFTTLFHLALAATSVFAAPAPEPIPAEDLEIREIDFTLEERANPALPVIAGISAKVTALNTAIVNWNGGDISKVQAASNALITTINKGTTTIKNGAKLNNAQALALTQPVQALTKKVETAVNNLIKKKAKVVSAGHIAVVRTSLAKQKTAATALSTAISNKVPAALKDIAAELSAGITKAIQKGINAYKTA